MESRNESLLHLHLAGLTNPVWTLGSWICQACDLWSSSHETKTCWNVSACVNSESFFKNLWKSGSMSSSQKEAWKHTFQTKCNENSACEVLNCAPGDSPFTASAWLKIIFHKLQDHLCTLPQTLLISGCNKHSVEYRMIRGWCLWWKRWSPTLSWMCYFQLPLHMNGYNYYVNCKE